jgi:hypothetical protein
MTALQCDIVFLVVTLYKPTAALARLSTHGAVE